ncbi:hypothetical protein DZK25_07745, partial [Wenzhouxiangella sp. 15181]
MASNKSKRTTFSRSATRAVMLVAILALALTTLSSSLLAQEDNQQGPQTLQQVLRAMQNER